MYITSRVTQKESWNRREEELTFRRDKAEGRAQEAMWLVAGPEPGFGNKGVYLRVE